MYLDYFGLNRLPFSIAPDPELLYLSPAHHEALAHLNYALTGHGGLICLTGEVGMGKTTLCRAFIDQAPASVDIAYIFNPVLSATELLQAICQELEVPCSLENGQLMQSNKQLIDVMYQALIERYASGRKVICIIDEAQSMPAPLLEQIRLLTNLETHKDKLLTLILVGQPELQQTLAQHSIRQLDQRITARFHLKAMEQKQLKPYLQHRLQQAGCDQLLFNNDAISYIWQAAKGIPRLINSISDRALLGAYATDQQKVSKSIAKQAVFEVLGEKTKFPVRDQTTKEAVSINSLLKYVASSVILMTLLVAGFGWISQSEDRGVSFSGISKLWADNHYQQLAKANGLDIKQYELENCQQIEMNSEFSCLSLDWPLKDLRRLQMPMAVFDGEQWQLVSAEQLTTTPIRSFILWQPVQGFDKGFEQALKPGESHELIAWVRNQLEQTQLEDFSAEWQVIAPAGQQNFGFNTFYDPILAEKIGAFQQQVGLKTDRLIGLKTLLALQSLTQNEGV